MTSQKCIFALAVLLSVTSTTLAATRHRSYDAHRSPSYSYTPPYSYTPSYRYRSTSMPNDTTNSIEYQMDMGAGAGR